MHSFQRNTQTKIRRMRAVILLCVFRMQCLKALQNLVSESCRHRMDCGCTQLNLGLHGLHKQQSTFSSFQFYHVILAYQVF